MNLPCDDKLHSGARRSRKDSFRLEVSVEHRFTSTDSCRNDSPSNIVITNETPRTQMNSHLTGHHTICAFETVDNIRKQEAYSRLKELRWDNVVEEVVVKGIVSDQNEIVYWIPGGSDSTARNIHIPAESLTGKVFVIVEVL